MTGIKYEIVKPSASAMLESMRAFGYSVQTAIADILDNSITAKAKNVWIDFIWSGKDSSIIITDDGCGMNDAELSAAMTPGSKNPLNERDDADLGRFGLGLKTASFSQCRSLTVASKKSENNVASRKWDLDFIAEKNEWCLLKDNDEICLNKLQLLNSGTSILWKKMDRICGDSDLNYKKDTDKFYKMIAQCSEHLRMIFHRFLEKNSLIIWMNGNKLSPWDPYLENIMATYNLPVEYIGSGRKKITIKGHILPNKHMIDEKKYEAAQGVDGWISHQGFYIYRNDRLLVPGSWLNLGCRKEEHYKLARISVDITNDADLDWQIDVKKSKAVPPKYAAERLMQIGEAVRKQARDVYSRRKQYATVSSSEKIDLWQSKIINNKSFQRVNREHPLIESIFTRLGNEKRSLELLLKMIEQTIPIQQIFMDYPQKHKDLSEPIEQSSSEEVLELAREMITVFVRLDNMSPDNAFKKLMLMHPFNKSPEIVNRVYGEIKNEYL